LRDAKPRVVYGPWVLAENGRPLVALVCPEDPAVLHPVAERIKDQADVAPVVTSTVPADKPVIVLAATLDGSDMLRHIVSRRAPGQVTRSYPRPGHYVIKRVDDYQSRRWVLIIGGDRIGLDRGAGAFAKFLTTEQRW
jgi:hypothetical protein